MPRPHGSCHLGSRHSDAISTEWELVWASAKWGFFTPGPERRSAFLPSPLLGLNVPGLGTQYSVRIAGASGVQSQLHSQKSLSKPGAPAVSERVPFCFSESSFWSHWKRGIVECWYKPRRHESQV